MKWKQPLAFLLLTALFLFACWRTLGWYHGEKEIFAFVADRYTIGGQEIVSGEYVLSQWSGQSVCKQFRVVTGDGANHRVSVIGLLRRNFNIVGPHTRILRVELDDGTLLPS